MITEDQRDTIGIKDLVSVKSKSMRLALQNCNDAHQLKGVSTVHGGAKKCQI